MHLLRAGAELLWSGIAMHSHVAHFETPLVLTSRGAVSPVIVVVVELTLARLLRRKYGLLELGHCAGAHAVHVLALLRSLMGHHGRSWPSWARVSIGSGHRLWRDWSRGDELGMGTRIHLHLGGAWHEG